jgi:hypothetical protein
LNVSLPAPDNMLLQLKSFQSTLETTSWSIKQQRHLQIQQRNYFRNMSTEMILQFGDPKQFWGSKSNRLNLSIFLLTEFNFSLLRDGGLTTAFTGGCKLIPLDY